MSEGPASFTDTVKTNLLQATEKVCGWTKKGSPRKQTWWWSSEVSAVVGRKRKLWKEWRKGGEKEPYLEAKRQAKHVVYAAKERAGTKKDTIKLYRIAKQMRRQKLDVIGEKCSRR
jgi:hypothetical protein